MYNHAGFRQWYSLNILWILDLLRNLTGLLRYPVVQAAYTLNLNNFHLVLPTFLKSKLTLSVGIPTQITLQPSTGGLL